MQFDWNKHGPPSGGLTFEFFFKPILPRLANCYWLTDYWPLRDPPAEAIEALGRIERDITPPRTILPEFAHLIVGDRDEFYGFLQPPKGGNEFHDGLHAASQRDGDEFQAMVSGPIGSKQFERGQRRYDQHRTQHGAHVDRYLDDAGVELAFMTNDGVWWIASRDAAAVIELRSYAGRTRGMQFADSPSFGY